MCQNDDTPLVLTEPAAGPVEIFRAMKKALYGHPLNGYARVEMTLVEAIAIPTNDLLRHVELRLLLHGNEVAWIRSISGTAMSFFSRSNVRSNEKQLPRPCSLSS